MKQGGRVKKKKDDVLPSVGWLDKVGG